MDRLNTTISQIAHFVLDEKFVDMALRDFETVAPGRNLMIVLGRPRALHYIKSKNVCFMTVREAKSFVGSKRCVSVIFHSLPDCFLPILKVTPTSKPKIWIGWGFDYYDRLLKKAYPDGLLLPKTRAIMRTRPRAGIFQGFTARAKQIVRRALGMSIQYTPELLSCVDWFVPVIDQEYSMACNLNPGFSPKYATWNYGTAEDDLGGAGNNRFEAGENILVGNNASATNNHLETFLFLKERYGIAGRKIIVPLNYGDRWYADQVMKAGRSIFGEAFSPILNFLPPDSYFELLKTCGHVFFNHLRQQALGNICISMLKGRKVYLNPVNPLFGWLSNRGGVIEPIISANSSTRKPLVPLSDSQKKTNRDIVFAHWGRDAQRNKTSRLVSIALNAEAA